MQTRIPTLDPHITRTVAIALGLWLTLAVCAGASGILHGVSAGIISATIWLLTLGVLVALGLSRSLRRWSRSLNLRWLVLFHGIRIIGIAFLLLRAQGRLPENFAIPGGHSGIVVAATAILFAFMVVPVRNVRQWWTLLAWNLFGLAANLRVVASGIQAGMNDMQQMMPLTEWPLSLLPTFIVPLVIVTHLLIFARLWRTRITVAPNVITA